MLVRGLTYATLLAVFLMILLGGLVHGTGSSLACPDWPLCYGEAFPKMEGGVLFEHSHRLLGTLIGTLTIALAAVLFRQFAPRAADRRMYWGAVALIALQGLSLGVAISAQQQAPLVLTAAATLALAIVFGRLVRSPNALATWGLVLLEAVVIQGLLGGLTVMWRLPDLVSSAHLGLSMLMFTLLVALAFRLTRGDDGDGAPIMAQRPLWAAAGVLFVQIVLGAFVKHTGGSYACGTDLVLCNGGMPMGGPAHVHMTHRVLAFVAAGLIGWSTVLASRAAKKHGRPLVRGFVIATHTALLVQLVLGFATVYSLVAIPLAMAHMLGGAVLLACMTCITLGVGPLGAPRRSAPNADAATLHGAALG